MTAGAHRCEPFKRSHDRPGEQAGLFEVRPLRCDLTGCRQDGIGGNTEEILWIENVVENGKTVGRQASEVEVKNLHHVAVIQSNQEFLFLTKKTWELSSMNKTYGDDCRDCCRWAALGNWLRCCGPTVYHRMTATGVARAI